MQHDALTPLAKAFSFFSLSFSFSFSFSFFFFLGWVESSRPLAGRDTHVQDLQTNHFTSHRNSHLCFVKALGSSTAKAEGVDDASLRAVLTSTQRAAPVEFSFPILSFFCRVAFLPDEEAWSAAWAHASPRCTGYPGAAPSCRLCASRAAASSDVPMVWALAPTGE